MNDLTLKVLIDKARQGAAYATLEEMRRQIRSMSKHNSGNIKKLTYADVMEALEHIEQEFCSGDWEW